MDTNIPLEPGRFYHIYNRGNNKEDLFREEKNYLYFLQLWTKHIEPVAESYAYCLLKNHFHFLVRVRERKLVSDTTSQSLSRSSGILSASTCEVLGPDKNLTDHKQTRPVRLIEAPSSQVSVISSCEVSEPFLEPKSISKHFSNLFNAYTKAFNSVYHRTGSLFQERFQRKLVTDESYFSSLVRYIHYNPQKHGFVEDFRDWPYSSYESHISDKKSKLNRKEVIGWFGGMERYMGFHRMNLVVLEEWDE